MTPTYLSVVVVFVEYVVFFSLIFVTHIVSLYTHTRTTRNVLRSCTDGAEGEHSFIVFFNRKSLVSS